MNNTIGEIVTKTINSLPVEITEGEAKLFNSFPIEEVVPVLRTLVQDELTDPIIASRSFDALLKLDALDKVDFLIDLFDNSNQEWRLVCCQNLSKFNDSRAVEKLCNIVLHDPSPDIRFCAAESLSIIGGPAAIAVLEKVKDSDTGIDYEGFKIADMAAKAIEKIRTRYE